MRNLFGLVRPIEILCYFGRRFCCIRCCRATTKREKRALREPPEFDFASAYSYDLLIATMGLVYSSISALIVPFALFYFGLNWLCTRYNLLYPKSLQFLCFFFCGGENFGPFLVLFFFFFFFFCLRRIFSVF